MKILSGVLLVAVCLVASTHAFPGVRDADSDEKKVDTVLILPSDQLMGATDFDDTDSAENPFWGWNSMIRSNLMDRWYSNIQAMKAQMRRLANMMAAGILSSISDEDTGSPWIKIPEGANTTSTTKVVDGHVVTVNETTYTDGDDESGIVIRVRVIDVRPENETILRTESEEDVEVTTLPSRRRTTTVTTRVGDGTTASRSVETVEDLDNEISGNQVETLNA
ncbi:icarapin-like [Ceratina calcarata]|uniref:Icarapin-like n=1 Tax=Ceratina calcarata TaxID=156304 RepID=A0AAJ7N4E5_9HYME|nr:icarapin-like [Ceratina calcarata]